MNDTVSNRIVNSVFQVLVDGSKQNYIGEKISQLEHSLQAAAQAREANADDETVLAALLHDIGQFATSADQKQMICDASELTELDPTATKTPGYNATISVGVTGHERIGAEYLRKLGFSEKVAQLVESHVPVKRYLTGKDNTYYDGLSGASKLSLKYQGGPFTPNQVKAFEQDPLFHLKIQVRKWDDAAKVVGLQVPDLESYRAMAVKHLMDQAVSVRSA
ncbi:hypothetical protein BDB00DRAFT_789812 [Zychaea mexicana]|uniref:uncharacterized protein n=1 Tax=Zychaea mexicana TaxID=64656 RepID=UPI0022FE834A|nr:uncharacterized protein BDB00DRAFT_789812 [Zychaea mexicana]KAI9491159.1 hypothetical protein BDB00DRAFT_789812 [Zychaea mexicana]